MFALHSSYTFALYTVPSPSGFVNIVSDGSTAHTACSGSTSGNDIGNSILLSDCNNGLLAGDIEEASSWVLFGNTSE